MEKFIILSVVLVLVTLASAADIISSPPVTNWGEWATSFEHCPEGTAAQGFDIVVDDWSGPLDDTSMNGIRLYCGNPVDGTPTITSKLGDWGKWGEKFGCDLQGYITGFQLKVEEQGLVQDETATNNIRIFCSKNNGEPIEADGERWGIWTEEQHCPRDLVVCGLKTQVQENQGPFGDNTALNNIQMECCPVPK